MQINIKSTKIDLTPAIKDYIQEKIDMLEKNLGTVSVVKCDVEVGLISNRQNKGDIYRCEVNLSLPGELLRVEKTEGDLYRAIDNVKDHLTRSIRRYKQKREDKNRENKNIDVEKILDVDDIPE